MLSETASRNHQLLLRRIQQHYETIVRQWDVLGQRIEFTQIAEPDRVLDQVAAEEDRLERQHGRRPPEDQLRLPYWAELWDSALGLAQHLARFPERCKDLSCIDLGCGMGLAGTVAARLGARVLFADRESAALLFARLNSLPDAHRVRARRLNWQTDRLDEEFDLILGADILYERKQWDFLEPFWRAHLRPGGMILLGEPGRQTGDAFAQWIRAHGWLVEQHQEPVSTRSVPIRLFQIRLGS